MATGAWAVAAGPTAAYRRRDSQIHGLELDLAFGLRGRVAVARLGPLARYLVEFVII